MANIITISNSITPVFNPATETVIDAEFTPIVEFNRNKINPVISESIEQVNSLFPTSSWSAWDERTLPWEGVGVDLSHTLDTDKVWDLSGLNYGFEVVDLFDPYGNKIPLIGILRDDNHYFLGSGTKRFVPIGNERTRELCDILFKMGFRYENAGCFDGGKVTYVSMKWKDALVAGENFNYYVVIVNSFDQTKPFGVYLTSVRVSCKNTLNLAIKKAKRFWKLRHTANAHIRLEEVKEGLNLLGNYIRAFETEVNRMKLLTCDKDKVKSFIDMLFPITEDMKPRAISSTERQKAELLYRWEYAPDLDGLEKSGARFLYAITDYVDHSEPLRRTSTWKEKRFANNMDGNDLLNKAYDMVNSL